MTGISPVTDWLAAAPPAQDRSAAESPRPDVAIAMVPGNWDDALSEEDRHYYLTRAEEELELAQHSRDPKVVHSHYLLASLYLERAYGSDPGMAEAR